MEPMRSIFIPKHPLPPTMELRPRLVVLDCCCRKSSKKRDPPSEPLVKPLTAPGPAPKLLGGPGRRGNSSAMSSVLTGVEMIEERRAPKSARKTCPRETGPGTRLNISIKGVKESNQRRDKRIRTKTHEKSFTSSTAPCSEGWRVSDESSSSPGARQVALQRPARRCSQVLTPCRTRG